MSVASTTPALADQLRYLVKGQQLPQNASFQRRSLLRTSRYVAKFVFWRLVRYLKYALVSAAIAAAGTGILGLATGGVGFLVAPSIPVAAAIGIGTGIFKFGWRHSRFKEAFQSGRTGDARQDERLDAADEIAPKRDIWERM